MHTFYKLYKNFLDEKVKSSTLLIFIITFLIIFTWVSFKKDESKLKKSISNIVSNNTNFIDMIEFNWKKYSISLVLQE